MDLWALLQRNEMEQDLRQTVARVLTVTSNLQGIPSSWMLTTVHTVLMVSGHECFEAVCAVGAQVNFTLSGYMEEGRERQSEQCKILGTSSK
jgi:hypothetical protein